MKVKGTVEPQNKQKVCEIPSFDGKIWPKPPKSEKIKKNMNSSKKIEIPRSSFSKNCFQVSKINEKYNIAVVLELKDNLKKSDAVLAAFSSLCLVLAWIENEYFFDNKNISTTTCHVLRTMVSVLCVIVNFYIYRHYKFKLEILKSQRIIYQKTNLKNSHLFKFYLVEILYNYVHCPPFVDFVLPNEQLGINFEISLDAYISVIMLGRFYVFFRLFDHYTFWTGERAIRVCKINGFLPNSKFALKAYLKYKSYWVLAFCLGFSILFFGFALRTFERPYNSPARRFNFNYIWNSFWCVVVTMTTIGYGDIYPQTHLGRLVIIVACIWGVFILSLFVVSLNNTITLTKEESKAFDQITHQDSIRKSLQNDAVKIIVKLMRLNISMKKKNPIHKKMLMKMDLIGLVNRFKIKRKNMNKTSKKISDILNEMHEQVNKDAEDVIQSIQPLKKIQPNIIESVEIQGTINDQTLEIFENSKKLMTLLILVNKKKLKSSVKGLNEVEAKYDYNGNIEVEDLNVAENKQTA